MSPAKYEKRLLSARTTKKQRAGDATDCFPFKLGGAITLHDQYVPGGGVGASTCLGGNFDSTKT